MLAVSKSPDQLDSDVVAAGAGFVLLSHGV